MTNHHKNARISRAQKAQNEWGKTLTKLELNIDSNVINYGDEKEYIKSRELAIEAWKKTWKFAITNDINFALEEDAYGGMSGFIGALYGDWRKWSWQNEEEENRMNKITKIFNELFDETVNISLYLKNHFFTYDNQELIEYASSIPNTIVKLIDDHFEPERKRIRDTIKELTPP